MTTKFQQLAESPRSVLYAVIIVAVAFTAGGLFYGLKEWASWVQAIGSVVAILVAVWVSWYQGQSQRRHDEAQRESELSGMLRSVRAELTSSLAFAENHIGRRLDEVPEGQPVRYTFPMAENPFPIFEAFIPKLGMIKEDVLRTKIVATFAAARSFVITTRYHNDMVAELDAASIRRMHDDSLESEVDLEIRFTNLAGYSASLRNSYDESINAGRELLTILRDA